MQLELIDDSQWVVFNHIEIAIIAVTGYEVTVLAIPLGVLDTHILCRNHLTVEHHVLSTVLLVVLLDQTEDTLYEMQVVIIRRNLQAHELRSLNQTIDTDGEILTADVDITGIEQRQHAVCLQLFQVLIIGHLYLMTEIDHASQILKIIELMIDGILDAAVQVDGQHTLRTCTNTTCTKGITEAVVCNLITQTAAWTQWVGIITHIGEERVSLSIHLSSKVAPLRILAVAILVSEQGHGLNREGKQSLGTLVVEPLHKALL